MSLLEEVERPEAQSFRASIRDQALDELTRLAEKRDAIVKDLDAVKAEIRSVRAVLSAMTTPSAKPGPNGKKRRPNGEGKRQRISQDRRDLFMGFLEGNENEFTSETLHEAFPHLSRKYCATALATLRSEGVVRLASKSGLVNIYRSMV